MIAYFLLVHRYPNQFKRLFKAIYDPSNHYLVHIDKRAGIGLHMEVKTFLLNYPNAHLLQSQNIVWGGYSMVDAELNGIKKLLSINATWEFFINLSGQDFPLKSQTEIKAYLAKNRGSDFMKFANQTIERPNTLNRIQNYFVEGANGFIGKPTKRHFLPNTVPYIGGQWKVLSRACCEFVINNKQVQKFIAYYKNTLIPDESFFQTVLMNTGYSNTIVNDDLRAIIWIPDIVIKNAKSIKSIKTTNNLINSGKIKLRPKSFEKTDLPFLLKSKALFARKFDITIDEEIIEELENNLNFSTVGNPHIAIVA